MTATPPVFSALVAVAALAACVGATAQTTVYRCGPDRSQYSQQPCPGGSAFDAGDARDPAQQAQARQLADLERTRAARLERERLASESAQRPAPAVALDARPAARPSKADLKPASGVKRPKRKREVVASPLPSGDFVARGAAPARANRPARRASSP